MIYKNISRYLFMSKGLLSVLLLAILFIGLGARPGLTANTQQITDKQISDAVEDELWLDPAVPSYRIDIATDDGVVTLSGTVDNILAKERAARIAMIVKGVRSVINEINVTPPVLRSDSRIRRDVKDALMIDPATDLYEINVDVTDNVVTLTGSVDSWQERRLCENVAKGVKGVTGVVNKITMSWPETRSDFEISKDIQAALLWDAFVDNALIEVKVKDGKVALSGTVGSAAEKDQAMLDAYVNGVKSVDIKDLKVNKWARDKDLRGEKYAVKSDQAVENAVRDALLYDPRVSAFKISAEAEDTQVTLRGVVDNLKAKRAAAQDAKNTVGVQTVVNRIKVRPDNPPSDKKIEKAVKSALLRDPFVESYEIDVNSVNGVVDLDGNVDTFFEKAEADDVASRINGVILVDNNLKVEEGAEPYIYDPYVDYWYVDEYYWNPNQALYPVKPDWEIASDIENELFWSPFVDADEVNVSVKDGKATLTGSVDSWAEYQAATDNAFDGGAIVVDNELTLK